MGEIRHFLDLHRLTTETLRDILDLAGGLKKAHAEGKSQALFDGKTLVMIFEKPSTRTRVSFQVAMQQLGGQVVVMSEGESQLGRGETVADTARVLSRYADAIMIRTDDPQKLDDLKTHATVPVINGLTDFSHPCQIMADVMTFEEHLGPIEGRVVAWSGDGNNVANSWIHAAGRFGFTLRLACPKGLRPEDAVMNWAEGEGADVTITDTAEEAITGADLVIADTWVSMGVSMNDEDADAKRKLLQPFRVDGDLMAKARAAPLGYSAPR